MHALLYLAQLGGYGGESNTHKRHIMYIDIVHRQTYLPSIVLGLDRSSSRSILKRVLSTRILTLAEGLLLGVVTLLAVLDDALTVTSLYVLRGILLPLQPYESRLGLVELMLPLLPLLSITGMAEADEAPKNTFSIIVADEYIIGS